MSKRVKTKFSGVYQRETEWIHNGKPDIAYDIAYKHNGKLIWEKIGRVSEGYSAELASIVKGERLRTIRHGEELPKEKAKAPLFKDAMKKYLEWSDGNRQNGRGDAECLYKNHLKYLDNKRLDEIHPFLLEKLKQDIITGKKLSPATAVHILAIIGGVFNKAKIWGYKGENPVAKVSKPTLQNKRVRFLSHDEATILLAALKERSATVHDIAVTSLYTGMRIGEITKLKGYDLDFQTGLIHVGDPKNKHPRKAYMTSVVREMLRTRIPDSPGDLIFKNDEGGKIRQISYTFTRVVDGLGFNKGITDTRQKVVAHSLRHTFASWLAMQGETIQVIAELLGHRTLAMTMRYSHLTGDTKRKAAELLERGYAAAQGKLAVINGGGG